MFNLGAVWGIDIGDSALKAVKLKRVGKQIVLQDFQIVRYSEIGGEPGARREGLLPQAITALQAAGLKHDRCMVSIAPQTVFSRFISLPPVDKRRVPEIVLYEAKQQIPFNLNEVIWAYESVRKEFVPGEEIEIGLFAVKREVIDAYLGELAPVWRQLHGIQVGPLGLYNFIRHEIAIEHPTVVIDIGAQSTDLLILDGSKFWLRNLPIAGNTFTSILEKRLNISRAEAEKLKYTVADSRHRRKLLEVLRPVMRDLVAEIQRSVGYYKSLAQAVKFEEILVTGEGYQLFGLDKFLSEQLQYKITPINEMKNIQYGGDPAREAELLKAMPALAAATGLALQGLGRSHASINLLPEDFIVRRELHGKRFSGLIAAALVWGIVASFYMKEARTLSAMSEMTNAGENTLKAVERLQQQFEAAQRGRDPARLKLFEEFGVHREYYARVIGALATVIPTHIEVTEFRFSEGAMTVSAGGSEGGMGGGGAHSGKGGAPASGSATPGATNADEVAKVNASKFFLTFRATCDAIKEPIEIQERFVAALKRARVYPQRIEVIRGVVVGPITRKGETAAASSGGSTANMVRGLGADAGGGSAASTPAVKAQLTADITIGLLTADEATAAIKKMAEEEKAAKDKEAAEAAAKAGEGEAAKAPAKPAPKAPAKK